MDSYKIVIILIVSACLTACSSKYAPLSNKSEHAGGYQERLLTPKPNSAETVSNELTNQGNQANKGNTPASYYLTYKGTTKDSEELITQYWHQRAKELCPNGYQVITHNQRLIYGTIKSPVNGYMATLGTQKPVDYGIIQCSMNETAPNDLSS